MRAPPPSSSSSSSEHQQQKILLGALDPAALQEGSPSSAVRSRLSTIYHNLHQIAKDNSISSDSGDSAVAFSSSSTASAQRTSTNDSTASTITPDKLHRLSQASTLSAGSTSSGPRPTSLSIATAGDHDAPTSILGQLTGAEGSVVDSPTVLKANDPFFSSPPPATRAPPSSLRAAVGARSLHQSAPSMTYDDFELQESWRAIARELKPIADVLRTDRLRTPLGSSKLPAECIAALRLSLSTAGTDAVVAAQTEILRVLANLCIDHEANRDTMHALSAATEVVFFVAQVVAQYSDAPGPLFSAKVLSLLRTSMGAVLNLQLEHIPTRKALLVAENLSTLTLVASHPKVYLPLASLAISPDALLTDGDLLERVKLGSTVSSWAWRVVQEVCEDEKEEKQQGLARPSSDDSQDDDDDAENLAKSLLSQHSFGDLLRPFLHYTPTSTAPTTSLANALGVDVDDVEELTETDVEILATVSELVEGCAMDEKAFRVAAVKAGAAGPLGPTFGGPRAANEAASHYRSPLDLMMTFVEEAPVPRLWKVSESTESASDVAVDDAELSAEAIKTFAKAKAALARAVVAIAGEDVNMTRLFGEIEGSAGGIDTEMGGWFIDRLKAWMRYDAKERDDLVSCGMLALGNLARTDAHCLALVHQHHLAPFLASLLSPSNDIKVSHGLVSLLKNLSIPPSNKTVIGSLGVIQAVTPFLAKEKDMVQPLQFGTVGLLKQLCAGVADNAIQVVSTSPSPSSSAGEAASGTTLTALLDLTKRVDDVPTRLEATRVVVNIVKALWSSVPGGGISADIAAARQAVVRRDAIQALAEMVRTSPKYPILVNEGIFALTLVGSERVGAELVAQSLLHEPARPSPDSDEDETMEGSGDPKAAAAAATRRRSTQDSAASTGSHPLPPPPAAVDMICSVLARRDARMPPQFAANACMLLLSLLQAIEGAAEASEDAEGRMAEDGQATDAVKQVAVRTQSALKRLQSHGPTEALDAAARALQAVNAVIGA
ncbi:uncharacterized protein PFL1_03880 [Pseudozyma flocculosa PF-1]|uniref:Uncharacterized protein n=2 Tax=Pseudozyma flocculosa TaxID=84751 RepID=A0A5C3EW60_9BASI|nr:uncharacterized protein PFL1_03880 [Pseudozyma flocculosa PF-1]EPQ28576.1 hypothetical protein PFL1_03880 [Pseudozyma flocculosa PF-1]SPO36514.1 uncharacterized protein PSFLO_01985 [Pseudozyma flocculosa]